MGEYEPIIDSELADRLERALAGLWPVLDDPLEFPAHSWMDPDWVASALAEGVAGPAIAVAHRALAQGDEALADRSRDLFVRAVEAGEHLWRAPGLIQGLTGLGYAVEHVAAIGLVEGIEDVSGTIAERVVDYLGRAGLTFDLFFGCAGMVVYGVERTIGSGSSDVLDAALERLEGQSAADGDRVSFRSVADTRWLDPKTVERYPDGLFDTGMSHGAAGVLAALAAAIDAGAGAGAGDRARALAGGCLRWLWDASGTGGERQWPNIIGETGGGSGWCRGDLGIAAGAYVAARALGDRDRLEAAAAAVGAALDRRDWQDQTPGLCHGPAGAAHIAHRFYRATGDPAFVDRVRIAAGALLDTLAREPTIGPGLWHGVSGIALAIQSLLGRAAPTWDRWMLPGM